MSLCTYLQEHFVDKPTFALSAGISVDRLDQLIAAKAVPAATYTCDGVSVTSAAFGATAIQESLTGDHYRPECVRWAKIANDSLPGFEQANVLTQLESELRAALLEHWQDPAAVESKIQAYLPHFWNGTFGLCVADPSSGTGIARKEILQEELTAATEGCTNSSPAGVSNTELLLLIDNYADSAMPFSPAEYSRSSRKRLVDDLRQQLAKA